MELMEVDKAMKDTLDDKEEIISSKDILNNKSRKMEKWEL